MLARCGRGGIRTLDLYSAIVALSQLSYAPFFVSSVVIVAQGQGRVKGKSIARLTIRFTGWLCFFSRVRFGCRRRFARGTLSPAILQFLDAIAQIIEVLGLSDLGNLLGL